ncbi:MAG: SOS response-associated peptidase [Calditrichaeota bacterium]|nr:SOS response-associated peptidase [Calditrichota bacterium]MCB9366517.1 SOS response-associated peptidase [Calditrichota bacterium]MCB9391225.1 SOS response-associated peptidase [Calditrichota bacterium]
MCNAYGTIGYSRSAFVHDLLGIPRNLDYDRPRKIVRPTDQVPVLRTNGGRVEQLEMRWGLIPAWSKQAPDRPLTNARSESVEELRSFSEAFRSRRCVMPADEFYEWTKAKKRRTFRPTQEEFLFAALWDTWRDSERSISSCVMMTTAANDVVAAVHDRMPVILRPEDVRTWLSESSTLAEIRGLLRPLDNELIVLEPDELQSSSQTSLF